MVMVVDMDMIVMVMVGRTTLMRMGRQLFCGEEEDDDGGLFDLSEYCRFF